MRASKRTLLSLALIGLTSLAVDRVSAQYTGDIKKAAAYEYRDIFPIFGKRLAARGIQFPKPWGAGLNYAFMKQPIDITQIALGINDSGFVDVSNIIKFSKLESKVHAANARVDLWLFPFLNVYALGNYAPNASTQIELSEPFPLKSGADQWVAGSGFGLTAAFGAFGAFATMDVNWTWNQAELLNETIRTTLLSPRVGTTVAKFGKGSLAMWVGAMGQIIGAETSGSIKLSDALGAPSQELKDKVNEWYGGLSPVEMAAVDRLVNKIGEADLADATVHYKLDKKVANRWNMLVGAQLELSSSWFLRAEVGFIKREQVMLGFNYRFNTPGF